MAALPQFHSKTGALISLSNNNRTAQRNQPTQEFNNGVVLSAEPLRDNQLFEVKIVKKVNSWSGSIEIGITTCNPDTLTLPLSATGLRDGTWVMSGTSILRDGHTAKEEYGSDLDQLKEGDRVGVMRSSAGNLHIYVNGRDQGMATSGVPGPVWAVVDLYGKCAQVSVYDPSSPVFGSRQRQNASAPVPVTCQIANDLANEFLTELSNQIASDLASARQSNEVREVVAAAVAAASTISEPPASVTTVGNSSPNRTADRVLFTDRLSPTPTADRHSYNTSNERMAYNERINLLSALTGTHHLTFHERCGTLIKLSNGQRTAERRRPMEEFNNGVVMTNRPLKDDELFEIRLDRLVDKWSGSIEVGITTHNPNSLEFPATMTNMRSRSGNRTIMMSGCGILTNGKGTRREYGQFNLDELTEGDRIGLIRGASGSLHYYINGMDQGLAASNCPSPVWGVVDLYGMAVKVTILDRQDPSYPNNPPAPERRANSLFRHYPDLYDEEPLEEEEEVEKLTFHPKCGAHAAVIGNQRTAHRPNAINDFNNGVVLTSRPLRAGEMFEVRLDKMVNKWAGSIEIGVTLHCPQNLDYPSTMTNIRSGTWMMTGNGVMHNGTTVIDEYGHNLDRLKVGDRVGVLRKGDGTLHFYVNGVDQGVAATSVPDNVFGVIDLYGQAAQATIIDQSDLLSSPDLDSSVFMDTDELKFHSLHGRNAAVINNGHTAVRTNDTGEFNDAIVMSSRAMRDNELFEVVIEKLVDRWSGSLEAGVTMVKPEDIDFPSTMTDIQYDTWMLSGAAIMQDGATIHNGYALDLDTITVGSRIGMMRCSDATLHFFRDGADQGVACTDIPSGVYAVVDLYGLCAQVSITGGSVVRAPDTQVVVTTAADTTEQSSSPSVLKTGTSHRFSSCCGKSVAFKNNNCTATRGQGYSQGVVFSSDPLKYDEVFEVRVEQMCTQWSGSLRVGLTTMAISDTTSPAQVPSSADQITFKITWLVVGSSVLRCGQIIKENYAPALDRLQAQGVSWDNCIAFGSDNAPVMTGQNKGVFAFVTDKNRNVYLAACTLHLVHIGAKKGAACLPPVEEILVDIYYFFQKSTLRQSNLRELQGLYDVEQRKMLKHGCTRWLSIARCIKRLLESWEPLKHLFYKELKTKKAAEEKKKSREKKRAEPGSKGENTMSVDEEQTIGVSTKKLETISDFLRSPTNRLCTVFLSYTLKVYDGVLVKLQAEQPLIQELHGSLTKLLQSLFSRFMTPASVMGKELTEVPFQERAKQKEDKDLLIGDEAREIVRHPEEHHLRPERIQEFYGNVRRYFETTCAYLLKKLPLRDPLLQHARLVDPAKQLTATQEDLHYFLERFPPLLPAGASVETIEEQFSTYQVTTITDCIGDTVDKTWVAISKAHPDMKPLCEVMLGICTIPHSSAACERVFSCVRKTCTDQRASLGQDTVEALLVVKAQSDKPHTVQQLQQLKSAYAKHQKQYKH
ncbi:hypothetical protein ACOMHN_017624 [Nucella lapillus]